MKEELRKRFEEEWNGSGLRHGNDMGEIADWWLSRLSAEIERAETLLKGHMCVVMALFAEGKSEEANEMAKSFLSPSSHKTK